MIFNVLYRREIFFFQAEDGIRDDLVTGVQTCALPILRIRLRSRTGGPEVPYRQLIMDVNPDAPTHWLNQRMNEGITARLLSRHEDNPRYWNAATQELTPEGYQYLFRILAWLNRVR